ncbi:MAG: PAS domain S-box protein, partial [Bryobacteraceae bacterium]
MTPTLLEREERFQRLFEEAPVAYHEIDAEGRVCRVNRAECEMLGFRREEILGRPVWDFVVPAEREECRESVTQKLAGEKPLSPGQRDYVDGNGRRLFLEFHENLIHDGAGRIAG